MGADKSENIGATEEAQGWSTSTQNGQEAVPGPQIDRTADDLRERKDGRKSSISKRHIDLDDVLINELGQFGKFQVQSFCLVAIPLILSAIMSEYIFSAAPVPHRCQIPECGENRKNVPFKPEWLSNAIPKTRTGFASCQRFVPVGGNGTLDNCPADLFSTAITACDHGYVYSRDKTVVYDFDLGCKEWLRALAGTLQSVGTLLVLPIVGHISDKFGRRVALIISVLNTGIFGLIRAFSVNYPMYLVLQLVQTTTGAGIFSSAYIFMAELVGPKWRVLSSALATSMFALGLVLLGIVAWLIQSWRYMIIVLHVPCFYIVIYYWIFSESVRWLISKKKFDEARVVLEKVARVNKKQISEKSMHALMNPPAPEVVENAEKPSLISAIFRSPILLRRVCTTPIWWITTTFVYYGLSINSTNMSGNMYLNFILTCAIEIPGFFTAVLILDRIGRKATLFIGYFLSACCNIAFAFIGRELQPLRVILFLLGKYGISIVFTSLYLFTSELYPTEYRHTLLAFSSMIGRIGSITAPLTPVLKQYWHGTPSMLFSCMGFLAGILVLTQPETLGQGMPDTLAEAEAIGKFPKTSTK